ncbi:MAG: arginine N-succinyltransferase [Phycisphaerales bacterium]|nr:arginine N-succinyltransferase [Phycisphaerales bacterium]
MFLIRQAKQDDLDLMLKLARMVHFMNLPADKTILSERIEQSSRAFRYVADPEGDVSLSELKPCPSFIFVIEDTRRQATLGTSGVISKMGGPGNPNLSFTLRRREFFSTDLQTGTTHITAQLYLDESGPTELGGLMLGPSFRRHPAKLGKQLSLIRFHFIGLHRQLFSDHLLAEMLAATAPDGRSVFWENFGRRFINLPYQQADRFCTHSREFMTSLLPREEIYLSFLPPLARKHVAQVGRETVPARRMLEDLGFKYVQRIDPFDGGPHLEAPTDEVPLVRDTATLRYGGTCKASDADRRGFVSATEEDGDFRACYTTYGVQRGRLMLPERVARLLRVDDAATVAATPTDLGITQAALNAETPTEGEAVAPTAGRSKPSSTRRKRRTRTTG